MAATEAYAPFPYTSIVLDNVPPSPETYSQILAGEGEASRLAFGYCTVAPSEGVSGRYLLLFQRKPYAAGVLAAPGEVRSTSLREFFVHLAQNPRARLSFFATDPILVKSVLVVQECRAETEGAVEYIRMENQVIGLMEGRKDALVAILQGDRYHFAFAKGGRLVKAYFVDQTIQSAEGLDWMELFRRIAALRGGGGGKGVRVRIYEQMTTQPAPDYVEGEATYPGGVYRYYTRPMPELIVRDRTRTLKRISVERTPFVIGRAEDSDLPLLDQGVSRRHAALEERDGRFLIRDLGSTNGLFVNDQFTKEFALQDGDRITLGGMTLQVVLPRSPAEDVRLVSPSGADATMAMDRNARVRVSCPKCGAAGSLDSARLYRSAEVRIRCPRCRHLFEPSRGGPA